MLLVDFGNSLQMEEAKTLLENLCQFCSLFVNDESNRGKTPEELIGPAELKWASRLHDIFHNVSGKYTLNMGARLNNLMSNFNAKHNFKYCFGNKDLKSVWEELVKHQKTQFEAVERLAQEDCITGAEGIQQVTERIHQCISKKKDEERRAKESRSCEIDRVAFAKTAVQRLAEEPGRIL